MNRAELIARLESIQLQLNFIVKIVTKDKQELNNTQEWTDDEPFLGQCTERKSE